MLYIVTGVRGAGKTTLIENLRKKNIVAVLQPSTTRLPRFIGETEYDFVDVWDPVEFAWSIQYGSDVYGMRRSEVSRALHENAATVFEPTSIEVFNEFRRKEGILSVTIGLDTIDTLAEQHERVAGSKIRYMDAEQFDIARRKVCACDVVLTGNEHEILDKAVKIINQKSNIQ